MWSIQLFLVVSSRCQKDRRHVPSCFPDFKSALYGLFYVAYHCHGNSSLASHCFVTFDLTRPFINHHSEMKAECVWCPSLIFHLVPGEWTTDSFVLSYNKRNKIAFFLCEYHKVSKDTEVTSGWGVIISEKSTHIIYIYRIIEYKPW